MKRTLLFSFCLFAASLLQAQNYEPMAIEGAHWIIFSILDTINHHALVIRGDTLVNGTPYKKMFRQELQSQATTSMDFLPPYYVKSEHLFALMRDDLATEKVYVIIFDEIILMNCGPMQEELLYDFSSMPGDTLSGCLNTYPTIASATIDSLSVKFEWGKNRQIQHISTGFLLTQGIGAYAGPFETVIAYPHPAKPRFLVDYCIGSDEACNLLPVSASEEITSIPFRIYPNPAGNFLRVELSEDFQEPFSIQMTTLTGQCYRQETVHGSVNRNISLDDLPAGMYFLTVRTEEGQSSRIFVKR